MQEYPQIKGFYFVSSVEGTVRDELFSRNQLFIEKSRFSL